jgi:hypothetical protein
MASPFSAPLGQLPDKGDDPDIRWRELVPIEVLRAHPLHGVTSYGLRFAGRPGALKEVERDGLVFVIMVHLQEMVVDLNGNAQFLHDFPFQTGFQAFTLLLLPAGEFPVTGQMGSFGPPGKQKSPLTPDQPGGDMNMGFTRPNIFEIS